MAYIATKATYIGEEDVLDETGKPVVDENDVPVKRIQTDVDDVIFETGEVIVLIEKEDEDQHFDLSIEDKGSKYFRPTQIKIGDGFHSFKELNWIQTFDTNRIESAVSSGANHVIKIITDSMKELDMKVNDFIDKDAYTILLELVKNNYFTLNDKGVLSCFSNDDKLTNKTLRTLSVGYNNSIYTFSENSNVRSGNSAFFGNDNTMDGLYNYIFGLSNKIYGTYNLAQGQNNTINSYGNNKSCTTCFGRWNEAFGNYNHIFGSNNIIKGNVNFCMGTYNNKYSIIKQQINNSCIFGSNNEVCGKYHFVAGSNHEVGNIEAENDNNNAEYITIFGNGNKTKYSSSFICGQYNNANVNTWFCIGNGTDNSPSNIFYIGKNGTSELNSNFIINGDLEVRGNFINGEEQLKSSTVGFRTTPTKNLYELSINNVPGVTVYTNTVYFKGIYEITIVPEGQSIESIHDAYNSVPIINQSFFKVYNGSEPFQLRFKLAENVEKAYVYIIIRKISDYGESQ